MPIDEAFKTGVWYDANVGDYQRIEEDEERGVVKFLDVDDGTVLEEVDPVDFIPSDFSRVDELAVEDPVAYYQSCVDDFLEVVQSTDSKRVPIDVYISFQYARERVEIVEK